MGRYVNGVNLNKILFSKLKLNLMLMIISILDYYYSRVNLIPVFQGIKSIKSKKKLKKKIHERLLKLGPDL
jgi:hypothetical protein